MRHFLIAAAMLAVASNYSVAQTTNLPAESQTFTAESLKSLPVEDQTRIRDIMRATKLIPRDAELSVLNGVKLQSGSSSSVKTQPQGFDPKSVCQNACEVTAGTAATACTGFSSKSAIVPCLTAASAGKEACRTGC
jgi:hypothetical protein